MFMFGFTRVNKMTMKLHKLYLSAALLGLVALPVRADIMYECVDSAGHKSFSNIKSSDKSARCTAMDLGPLTTVAPPATQGPSSGGTPTKPSTKTPTPPSFPKVDDGTQKSRDTDRRRILEGELALEQSALEQAKKELATQETTRNGDERNYQKVIDRVQKYKDTVALHARNVEAIQKEISNLR